MYEPGDRVDVRVTTSPGWVPAVVFEVLPGESPDGSGLSYRVRTTGGVPGDYVVPAAAVRATSTDHEG